MKIIVHAAAGLLLASLGTGCNRQVTDPDDIPRGTDTGQLRVIVTTADDRADLDPRVDELWVRVDSLMVRHEEEGWIELAEERMDLDLVGQQVRGGNAILGEADVWVGAYDRLRIALEDAWIVVDGQETDLAFQGSIDPFDPLWKGLVVDETFFVEEETLTTVRLVWNVVDNLSETDGNWLLRGSTVFEVDIGG